MKRALSKVLVGLGKGFLACWAAMSYCGLLAFLAALYAGGGHGNETPMKLLNMPSGYGAGLFIIAATLSPFARNKVIAAIGALVLLFYFRGLWIEDFAGTLRRFSFATLSQPFVTAVYVYLAANLGLLGYFVFRICTSRKRINGSHELSAAFKSEL